MNADKVFATLLHMGTCLAGVFLMLVLPKWGIWIATPLMFVTMIIYIAAESQPNE